MAVFEAQQTKSFFPWVAEVIGRRGEDVWERRFVRSEGFLPKGKPGTRRWTIGPGLYDASLSPGKIETFLICPFTGEVLGKSAVDLLRPTLTRLMNRMEFHKAVRELMSNLAKAQPEKREVKWGSKPLRPITEDDFNPEHLYAKGRRSPRRPDVPS